MTEEDDLFADLLEEEDEERVDEDNKLHRQERREDMLFSLYPFTDDVREGVVGVCEQCPFVLYSAVRLAVIMHGHQDCGERLRTSALHLSKTLEL